VFRGVDAARETLFTFETEMQNIAGINPLTVLAGIVTRSVGDKVTSAVAEGGSLRVDHVSSHGFRAVHVMDLDS
jgi:hypothetical protein